MAESKPKMLGIKMMTKGTGGYPVVPTPETIIYIGVSDETKAVKRYYYPATDLTREPRREKVVDVRNVRFKNHAPFSSVGEMFSYMVEHNGYQRIQVVTE